MALLSRLTRLRPSFDAALHLGMAGNGFCVPSRHSHMEHIRAHTEQAEGPIQSPTSLAKGSQLKGIVKDHGGLFPG